ncbi:MAG: glycoside hydrolase [Bacteroidales bacterium]|nr:glycoside hydrolase [Bacteroidales bacterium]
MKKIAILLFLSLILFSCAEEPIAQRIRIDLSGEWQTEFGAINLPGTTDEALFGDEPADTTATGQLTRRHSIAKAITYSREIEIPDTMADMRIILHMEKTKPSTLSIDGMDIESYGHLHTPHVYDLTYFATPGKHLFEIKIDNSERAIPQEISGSHAISEATQTNWNGILGDFYIEAMPKTSIESIMPYPDVDNKNVMMKVVTQSESECVIIVNIKGKTFNTDKKFTFEREQKFRIRGGKDAVLMEIPMDGCPLWSEHNPALCEAVVTLRSLQGTDVQKTTFGMRKFATDGTQFTINNKPTFLRGKHDACVFPQTGYAPMDVESWLKIFKTAKAYGINHYRFHSWCPPEAAFEAADLVGIYLQPELPFWGCFEKDKFRLNRFLYNEGIEILDKFGSHPSFVMMALGNELCGDVNIMRQWKEEFHQRDDRHLYAFGSNNNLGWQGQQEGEDFLVTCRIGGEEPEKYNTHVRASFSFADAFEGGILNGTYPNTRMNFDNALKASTVPVVSHETCQFQIYPDFAEEAKYTGVLAPMNLREFRRRLGKQFENADEMSKKFHMASGKLAMLCYKADIEMCLRSHNMGGFQMLDLQDYPGQGTALVGVLDAFMESKGLIEEEEFRGFCSDIVPLALMDKYTWTTNEHFVADIAIANYSEQDFGKSVEWTISDKEQNNIAKGTFDKKEIKSGKVENVGHIDIDLSKTGGINAPSMMTLSLNCDNRCNTYNIYVYSDDDKSWENIRYATELNDSVKALLENGETVIFSPKHADIENVSVGGMFTPDYWNYAMFKNISQIVNKPVSPGTLGYLIDDKNATLTNNFPTQFHSDWQWWTIAKNTRPIIIDGTAITPDVMAIDNIDRAHKLGVLFSLSIGKGHLVVCMTDLKAITDKPEGRQYIRMIGQYAKEKKNATEMSWENVVELFSRTIDEEEIAGIDNISDYSEKR